MAEKRQREHSFTGSSGPTNSSTGLKKSASSSFVSSGSKSRDPGQEQFKLGQPRRKSDTCILADKAIVIKSYSPRAVASPEEAIRTAIQMKLQQYTKSVQKSLEKINGEISGIYDLVGKEVDLVLQRVKLQKIGSSATITGFKVVEHPMSVTVKPTHEETTEVNLAVTPITAMSPTPTIGGERPESADSVETNKSAPQSASSQRSIQSSNSERPFSTDSVETNKSPQSAPGQHSIQSSDNERPFSADSVETNKSPPQSASSQRSVQSPDSGNDIQYSTSSVTNSSNENGPAKVCIAI